MSSEIFWCCVQVCFFMTQCFPTLQVCYDKVRRLSFCHSDILQLIHHDSKSQDSVWSGQTLASGGHGPPGYPIELLLAVLQSPVCALINNLWLHEDTSYRLQQSALATNKKLLAEHIYQPSCLNSESFTGVSKLF